MKKMYQLLFGIGLLAALSGCASIDAYTKVLHKEREPILGAFKVAVFPAFSRSGVRYAKRKLETILRYHLLVNEKQLGWKMTFPDDVKQAILDAKVDDLYLVIYHKYNALSHFSAQDLTVIGKKHGVAKLFIPEMVQESEKSGPYWVYKQGGRYNLTTLYSDYYIRLLVHVFDVDKGKFVARIRSIGKVKNPPFAKDNREETLGKAYSIAIEKILLAMLGKK